MSAPALTVGGGGPLRRVGSRLARLQSDYPIAQAVSLAAIFIYGAASLTGFSSRLNIYSMLVLAALLGVAAAGQTLVVLIGGVDLSIAGWITAGATTNVELIGTYHWSFITAFALTLAIALVVGGIAGYVAHRFLVHPLIVTLATGAIVGGGVLVWSKGFLTGTPPIWLQTLTSPAAKTFGISFPPLVIVWLGAAVVIGIVLRRTIIGRRLFATGANPVAADLALVRTRRVWVGVYAASAMLAVCAGELLAGYAGGGDSGIGQPYLFQSLTAVVVGGTAFGAIGDYWRTVMGSLVLIVLTSVLIGHGLTSAEQEVVSGVLIFIFVAFYGRERRLRDRI